MNSLSDYEVRETSSFAADEYPVKPMYTSFNKGVISIHAHDVSGIDKNTTNLYGKNLSSCHVGNVDSVFSTSKFNDKRHPPATIGRVESEITFSTPSCDDSDDDDIKHNSAEDLLIKVKGSGEYHLPVEVAQFEEALQKIVDVFHACTPNAASDYYCYLSFISGVVPPDYHQRFKAIHTDGFVGAKHMDASGNYTALSDTIFTVCDILPTEFFVQSIDVSALDPQIHDYCKYFEKNVTVKPQCCQKPYEIAMFDAYTLHRSPLNNTGSSLQRTFLRINFTPRFYDNKLATRNLSSFADVYAQNKLHVIPHKYMATVGYVYEVEEPAPKKIAPKKDEKENAQKVKEKCNMAEDAVRKVIASAIDRREFASALDMINAEKASWISDNITDTTPRAMHMLELRHLEGAALESLGRFSEALDAFQESKRDIVNIEEVDKRIAFEARAHFSVVRPHLLCAVCWQW